MPHRVHTSKAYPLKSPNGSTIIVYGHEQGLSLLWRGGLRFKVQPENGQENSTPNGTSQKEVMVIDSDDNEPAEFEESHQEDPVFDEEQQELDSTHPYETILQSLDLPLGVEVLCLSFPHLPADLLQSDFEPLPRILSQSLILSIACSDCSIRVLTIPLMPPTPQHKANIEGKNLPSALSTGKSLFGEQMVILSGGSTHQSIPKGISISLTSGTSNEANHDETRGDKYSDGKTDAQFHGPSRVFRTRSLDLKEKDRVWEVLVVSHSADVSGLLLLHRIPLARDAAGISADLHIPWQVQYLASPAVSVEFSSALYPASQHSRILVAEARGVVRVLDCLPWSKTAHGSWLVSLYTGFYDPPEDLPRRKSILCAKWVFEGKAILVLQTDGKWGVWDLELTGPKSTNVLNHPHGTLGGALATYAIDGWVGDSLFSRSALKGSSMKAEGRSKLAPMTPSTRKMRQEALFTGPITQPEGPARGGLFVLPIKDVSNSRPDDESVLLWHRSNILIIPSLFTYWQNKARGSGNLFGSGTKGEPKTINHFEIGGELCNEIGLFPSSQPNASQAVMLITGEHRLILLAPLLAEPDIPTTLATQPVISETDQQLLARKELDVNGMDRILAGMSNGHAPSSMSQTTASKHGGNLLVS